VSETQHFRSYTRDDALLDLEAVKELMAEWATDLEKLVPGFDPFEHKGWDRTPCSSCTISRAIQFLLADKGNSNQ
jgi:hypothetical protein